MYTTRQVADLLALPPWQVRAYARAGFITPERTERGSYTFAFQDLVLLRTAARLASTTALSHQRVRRTFERLRRQIPPDRSLTEIGIVAETRHGILVEDGETVWEPESGQLQLKLDPDPLAPDESRAPSPTPDPPAIDLGRARIVAQGWFELGCEQEADRPDDALESYRRAVRIDPSHADAHVRLGLLLQTLGEHRAAAAHYEAALTVAPYHATAAYRLGRVRIRLRDPAGAVAALEQAIEADPDLADAHYEVAQLHEKAGRPREALRHFQVYKALTGGFRPRSRRRRR